MKNFLEGLKPKNTFICFTHCDENKIDDKFIKEKLKSLIKYGKIEIPFENVIKFNKTQESLESFVKNMVHGKINFVEDLDDALEYLDNDMPEIAI